MKLPFLSFLVLCCCLFSCQNDNNLQIIIGENATTTEKTTAEDLKADLSKVTDLAITIVSENKANYADKKILLGTSSSNQLLAEMLTKANITLTPNNPGARGGIWQKIDKQTIVLAGSDLQGMQYAVYDYSKLVLGIDPLHYWTGHPTNKIGVEQLFQFENKKIAPPLVPLLVYFENDVDELANLKKPLLEYDWASYTEMIDALVRMRYNGIQLFDMLGRPEFFLRPTYQKIRPDYDIDLTYIEKMIDYAHDKGMKVQIDMAMGYKIKSLESKYADCWKDNKDKWFDIWNYYLTKTPIGKADIFSLRPRNQVWDWEYKSTCGENKIAVFNEVSKNLDSIITRHNPKADKVIICYSDGMKMFNQGFTPPKDWIIAWSDDGYAGFKQYPESTKGYPFGTYMHAGYWKNHTVSHPYPEQIDTIMKKMFTEYQATAYCEVNGQQFRPFIFNLEAFSTVCNNPESYSGNAFYQKWAKRYFSKDQAAAAIEIMQLWDKASFGKAGYVQNLWEIREVISYLSKLPIVRPGKTPTPYEARRVENDLVDLQKRLSLLETALTKAKKLLPKTSDSHFFHDQVYFPIQLYMDLLTFENMLHQLYAINRKQEVNPSSSLKTEALVLLKTAREQLAVVYKNRIQGDKNPRWKGWYNLAQRRPNNGFPTVEMMDAIELAIMEKW
ncbi:MAG: glycosyl hydrolase 115 family protein [Saprospiraceae bacterium]